MRDHIQTSTLDSPITSNRPSLWAIRFLAICTMVHALPFFAGYLSEFLIENAHWKPILPDICRVLAYLQGCIAMLGQITVAVVLWHHIEKVVRLSGYTAMSLVIVVGIACVGATPFNEWEIPMLVGVSSIWPIILHFAVKRMLRLSQMPVLETRAILEISAFLIAGGVAALLGVAFAGIFVATRPDIAARIFAFLMIHAANIVVFLMGISFVISGIRLARKKSVAVASNSSGRKYVDVVVACLFILAGLVCLVLAIATLPPSSGTEQAIGTEVQQSDTIAQRTDADIAWPMEQPGIEWEMLNKEFFSLYTQAHYEQAVVVAEKALRVAEGTFGPNHANVATSLNNLALTYSTQGDYAKAEPLYKRSLEIWEKTIEPDHPQVATLLYNLATLYVNQAKYAEAEPLLKRSVKITEKSLGLAHPDVAASLNGLAVLYATQGKYSAAEPLYKRSLEIREKGLGPDHPDVASSLNDLASLYSTQGEQTLAEPLFKRALEIREKTLGADHPHVAMSLHNLAALYGKQSEYSKAEPLFKRALDIWEKALGPDHPYLASMLSDLAYMYYKQRKFTQAEPLYNRSLEINEKVRGSDHPEVARSLNGLAVLYRSQAKYAQAEPLYNRALDIWEKALGPDDLNVAVTLENLAMLYHKTNREKRALELEKRAAVIRSINR